MALESCVLPFTQHSQNLFGGINPDQRFFIEFVLVVMSNVWKAHTIIKKHTFSVLLLTWCHSNISKMDYEQNDSNVQLLTVFLLLNWFWVKVPFISLYQNHLTIYCWCNLWNLVLTFTIQTNFIPQMCRMCLFGAYIPNLK